MNKSPDTVFVDIDGTILPFVEDISKIVQGLYTYWAEDDINSYIIKSNAKKLAEWHSQGIRIILVTGRPEPLRGTTEELLREHGMIYDQLIMGCGSGRRFLINDSKDKRNTAIGLTIDRDLGIGGINLDIYE